MAHTTRTHQSRLCIAMILFTVLLSACAQPMTICGTTYESYGFLSSDDKKTPGIKYELIWGNVIWGVLLAETVVAPIYFFGFSLFEPTGRKPEVTTVCNGDKNDEQQPQ